MPITHNIKSPVTLAAADITAAEIADGAVTDSKVNFSNPLANKNLVINGGMNIWQRSTSESSLSSVLDFRTVDRWKVYIAGAGTWTWSRSTDVPSGQGFTYSQKWDCTSATATPTNISLRHNIEGQNLQHLCYGASNAKSITISFWVKSNVTGTYCLMIQRFDISGANVGMISKSYTINVANTWEKKTITYEGHTSGNAIRNDSGKGFHLQWWMAAGSGLQSGTLQTSWGSDTSANKAVGQVNLASSTDNEWYLTGVQLEVGEQATSFEFEPFETTLRKCRRYYVRFSRTGPPAEPYTHAVIIGHGQSIGSNQLLTFLRLYEPMRGVPDVGYSAADDFAFNLTASSGNLKNSNAIAIYNDADHADETLSYNPILLVTTSNSAQEDKYGRFFINDSTNGWLELDAEI